jgi:hypothetical protein
MRRFNLNGRQLRILFVRFRRKYHGLCDPPGVKPREIWVDRRLKGRKLLEIVLHEVAHARFWWMPEKDVQRFARDLSRLIIRLGFRECSAARAERDRRTKAAWRWKPTKGHTDGETD